MGTDLSHCVHYSDKWPLAEVCCFCGSIIPMFMSVDPGEHGKYLPTKGRDTVGKPSRQRFDPCPKRVGREA